MKIFEEKSKESLFFYAKERYLWEHTRKNEINSSITIPLGILIFQITSFSYFLLNFPSKRLSVYFFVFIILLCLSIISLALSVIFFLKHQIGYKYGNIQSPKDIENYFKKYIAAYIDINEQVDYHYIYNELKEMELSEYIEATERNISNNETKIKFYRHFIITVIISTVLLLLTLISSLFLEYNMQLIRVIIENPFME